MILGKNNKVIRFHQILRLCTESTSGEPPGSKPSRIFWLRNPAKCQVGLAVSEVAETAIMCRSNKMGTIIYQIGACLVEVIDKAVVD